MILLGRKKKGENYRSLCNIIRFLFLIGGPEIKLSKLNEHNVQGDV